LAGFENASSLHPFHIFIRRNIQGTSFARRRLNKCMKFENEAVVIFLKIEIVDRFFKINVDQDTHNIY
jgi:hypothetical protein